MAPAAERLHCASLPSPIVERCRRCCRYPKDNNAPPRSPLQRTISLVEGFFKSCSSVHCLPLEGRNLVSYELHTFQAAELANELDVTNLRS